MITGIFPGSFNPIHIGHLALANWICEFCDMDELWFMVTPQNPQKDASDLIDENIRLQMVRASVAGYPKFKASDFEFALPRPFYTIHTLYALRKAYSGRDFRLIIGADSWHNIHQWKDSDALVETYPILIYPRKGYETTIPEGYSHIQKVDAPLFEVSSTFIRQSLSCGKDIRYFLPEAIRTMPDIFCRQKD